MSLTPPPQLKGSKGHLGQIQCTYMAFNLVPCRKKRGGGGLRTAVAPALLLVHQFHASFLLWVFLRLKSSPGWSGGQIYDLHQNPRSASMVHTRRILTSLHSTIMILLLCLSVWTVNSMCVVQSVLMNYFPHPSSNLSQSHNYGDRELYNGPVMDLQWRALYREAIPIRLLWYWHLNCILHAQI